MWLWQYYCYAIIAVDAAATDVGLEGECLGTTRQSRPATTGRCQFYRQRKRVHLHPGPC